jgi:hypothetical protein
MSTLIKSKDVLEIGGFLNKWFERRLARNQNVILVLTGPTGSSKTYNALSTGECWYDYRFKRDFPKENICFGVGILAKRIKELEIEGLKGQILILEEAGANFGNLDFQNKLSKMFSYILQSFRSLNLILIMTLPVLTMLNKTARQLVHAHFITAGIDYDNEIAKVKPLFHQLNQLSGKSYWKYPRVRIDGRIITLQKLKFNKPSDRLIQEYEELKYNFVSKLTSDFIEETAKFDRETIMKFNRKGLTSSEIEIFEMMSKGLTIEQMANERRCGPRAIYDHLHNMHLKGYDTKSFLQDMRNANLTPNDNATPIT